MRTLAPGSVISHYRIQDLIAHGGMGEVYKAVDLSLGRTVAIKIPNPQIASDASAKNRFLREAHAASRLTHPNICTIYEVGEEGGLPFIVMAYIAGTTLRDLIARGTLAIATVIQLAAQIADALSDAHRHGIVHRDLKPSNIMVNSRGQAIILDFGLAKLVSTPEGNFNDIPTLQPSLTQDEMIVGTVAYMSPEQIRARPLDGRSDIFSFGILLFEMLAGHRPFEGGSQIELMHAILHQEPPSLREYRQGIGAALAVIIRRALEKETATRYQTAGELRADLQAAAGNGGVEISQAMTAEVALTPRLALADGHSGSSWRQHLQEPRVWLMGGMATLLLLTMVKMIWTPAISSEPLTSASMKVMPPHESWKSEIGDLIVVMPRFSPDARSIAYSATRNGTTDIWIKKLDGSDAEPIAVTKDQWVDTTPIFSDDGSRIVYLSDRNEQWEVWEVSAQGGPPSKIGGIDGRSPELIAWSQDGQQIYYENAGNLYSLGVTDHTINPVTKFPQSQNFSFRLSSDERHIVFVREEADRFDIWVQEINGANLRRMTNDLNEESNPIWHPDGNRIIYNSLDEKGAQVRLAYLDRRSPVQLTSGELEGRIADISRDGSQILIESSDDESDLWITDSVTGNTQKLNDEVGAEIWPEVSKRGTLAYQATQRHDVARYFFSSKIYLLDGVLPGGDKPNANAATWVGEGFEPRWSSDGQKVAFLRFNRLNNEISLWVKASGDGDPHQVSKANVKDSEFTQQLYHRYRARAFDWAPDNQRIAYITDQSGVSNIVVSSVENDEPIELTDNENNRELLREPTWSPDGKRVAYLRVSFHQKYKRKYGLWVNQDGTDTSIHESPSAIRLLGWTADGTELIFATLEGGDETKTAPKLVAFWRKPLAGGLARQIARQDGVYFHNLHLAPDRRQIAYVIRKDGFDCLAVLKVDTMQKHFVYRLDEHQSYLTSIAWTPGANSIVWAKFVNIRSIGTIERYH
jgi:serine/threonine protein kinase